MQYNISVFHFFTLFFRCFERIVPVVYSAPSAPEDPAKYRRAKDRLEEQTNTGCLPWIIKLGGKLVNNKNLVDQQIAYFREKDPALPPRVHKLYGLYKAIVIEVKTVFLSWAGHS